jgi:hypothetical protein
MKGFKVAVFHMKFCILLLEKIKEECASTGCAFFFYPRLS